MSLAELFIHPLKSGRGIALAEAEVTPMGLAHDRRYMLATPEGRFLTGREHPRLVGVTVDVDRDGAVFNAPGMAPLAVRNAALEEALAVVVWSSGFNAHVGDAAADAWFSQFLGLACRLCFVDGTTERRTRMAPEVPVGFADGYPVLLIGTASLADLNRRLAKPVSVRHFRANLLVETTEPYVEDRWRQIQIGGVLFENMKRCERCIFTTIDPETGIPDPQRQPLLTLASYRRFDAGPCLGINLVPRSTGMLRRGDAVTPG